MSHPTSICFGNICILNFNPLGLYFGNPLSHDKKVIMMPLHKSQSKLSWNNRHHQLKRISISSPSFGGHYSNDGYFVGGSQLGTGKWPFCPYIFPHQQLCQQIGEYIRNTMPDQSHYHNLPGHKSSLGSTIGVLAAGYYWHCHYHRHHHHHHWHWHFLHQLPSSKANTFGSDLWPPVQLASIVLVVPVAVVVLPTYYKQFIQQQKEPFSNSKMCCL
jgi:hypothetical protein